MPAYASEVIETGKEKENSTQTTDALTRDRPNSPLPSPLDGGFHVWVQVVAGHLDVALTLGYASSFGVFQNYYDSALPQAPSGIS
ncbi:Major facilitator superfamily domain general substrate transporter [Penicillium hordei]|uniref:Major facilitator superfamily domain general substrate transporter n=1 Tax=Penicillium hordei TaxID=40994 RepID=A0AAD6DL53_9EURO|nr:Major facilitator superfamily domain general substrate transporter [Penicillium hordei]KAJ5588085.1 Major facilitator superfamily domain general substrate transporter [Penicillium hordei]